MEDRPQNIGDQRLAKQLPEQYSPDGNVPAGQWVYQIVAPTEPHMPKSGYRVSAGIISIVLGVVQLMQFLTFFRIHFPPRHFLDLVLALPVIIASAGTLVFGIRLLWAHRERRRGAPVTLLAFASLALAAAIGNAVFMPMFFPVLIMLLAVPAIVLLAIGLFRETRGL